MTELQSNVMGQTLPLRVANSSYAYGQPSRAPLKILMVTPRYFPFTGGVESHVYEVARRLVRLGAAVTVLTTNPGGSLPASETVEGVSIRRVRAYPAARDYYFAPGLWRVITRGGWDLVHIQSYHTLAAPLAMFAAWSSRVPYVVTFHGGGHSSSFRNSARTLQRALLRPLLKRANRLVAIANFEQTFFEQELRLPASKFVVIPNGCDLPEPVFESAPSDGLTWIASIGRLEAYKGHQRMLAALPTVVAHNPNVRLWIMGGGPYESALRAQANTLGMSNFVRIESIPPQARTQMAKEISRMQLVVLFSDYETHPIAILEALSLRRPVLVTETSGLGELVARGLARGVPLSSTPRQVADAIVAQLDHPFLPPALSLPTWDACAKNLLDLYRNEARGVQCVF